MVGDVMNWLPAIGSLIGSIGQGIFSAHSASKAFERQKELWEYMQSNAHQLEVQDLKKAGLNPILSATNGQLAGMPSVGQERTPDNDLGAALNSAISASVADKQVNVNYDVALKQIAQRNRELDIMENQSAAQIQNLQAQRDEVLERIKGIIIDNNWKDRLHEADVSQRDSLTRKFFAEAEKAVQESSLVKLQQEKLLGQLKYGEIFVKYLPKRLADKVISKLDAIIDRTDFKTLFRDKVAEGSDIKDAALDYIDVLKRSGVIGD